MRSSRLFVLLSAFALPLLQGCGPSCEDACSRSYDCLSRMSLGWTHDATACIAECEKGFCNNPERDAEAADCYANMLCENGTGATGEMLTCASKCD